MNEKTRTPGEAWWEVHNQVERVALCKYVVEAAMLVSPLGDGSTIRRAGRVLWTEGPDGDGDGGESYDHVEEIVLKRWQRFLAGEIRETTA